MVIVHYFLGFPPYRTGGLTRYALDLMITQLKDNHRVYALWPGQISLINRSVRIIKNKKTYQGIENYEITNPLPVPLDEGVCNVDAFMQSCDARVYEEWLTLIRPDVIHVHTLMGIHREFFLCTKKLHIRTVYTTHDYYGLCPKVTFYRENGVCDGENCEDCCLCNESALSLMKITLLQSHTYARLKNTRIIKMLRKKHRTEYFNGSCDTVKSPNNSQDKSKYELLRNYYIGILESIDCIHFNSTVSEQIYRKFITPNEGIILSITHSGVKDNRLVREHRRDDTLRIAFLSPTKPYKGFDVLKSALDRITTNNTRKIKLFVYGPVRNPSPYMIVKEDGFNHSNLKKIMDGVDVLVAPSVWYETFGFTVLEALSFGVPVIVSDRVGAKDIVGNGGIIVHASSVDELVEAFMSLTPQSLEQYEKNIKNNDCIVSWNNFMKSNYNLYSGSNRNGG